MKNNLLALGWMLLLLCFGVTGKVQAQGADGTEVYLQGFHWESADAVSKDWWNNLNSKINAIKAADIDAVWLPPSSDAGDRAGYLPRKWYDLNSNYGTEQELRNLISNLNQENIKVLADIVINHRVGCTSWADFCEPALDCNSITSDDEVNQQFPGQGCGDFDTGTPYEAARDLNHNDAATRQAIKDWMNWLISDVGYAGWRYDFVHGFAAGYFAEYNNATSPFISIGENWNDNTQTIVDWMDGAQATSTAFDFPLKFTLHSAVGGNYGALNNGGKMPGVAGVWPQNSVTFLENHDTEPVRQADHGGTQFPNDPTSNTQILQGYAYILTHPGNPMVFYSHLFDYGIYDEIAEMIALRKANGIFNNSSLSIQQSDGSGYAAIIDNKLAVKIGGTGWSPSGSGWVLQASGVNYAIWDKGTGVNNAPVLTIAPNVLESADPISVSLSVSDDTDSNLPIYYTLDGTEPSTSSTQYTGAFTLSTTTTVKALSVDSQGKEGTIEKTYYIGESAPVMTVYVKKPANWSAVYAHHWEATPASSVDDTTWPGVQLQAVAGTSTWYYLELPGANASNFVFHDNNGNQDDDIVITGTAWYDGGTVTPNCTSDCPVEETIELNASQASTTFESSIAVSLTATSGATIYYTTDNSEPTESSSVYSSTLTFSETTTLKAKAFKDGNNSDTFTATYTKQETNPTADAPIFSLAGQAFDNSITVSLSNTSGCQVYYTTDGSTPSASSIAYTGAITLTETTTIKAITICDTDNQSSVVTNIYTKNDDDIIITPPTNDIFTWDNASVYFMMTDRFNDGDPSNNRSYGRGTDGNGNDYTDDSSAGEFHGGDLKGITAKLREGYFESIGINAIWITAPIEQMHGWVGGSSDGSFRHYGYHGYYALDWSEIDKNMGTEADLMEFVDEAHSRGIRIVMDVVMNHTGYATMHDMEEYNYGSVDPSWRSWSPSGSESWHSYHENFVDYTSGGTWLSNYWGTDWMRHPDIEGYDGCSSGGGIENCVGFLPDLKTEDVSTVGIPPILINKWTAEGTLSQKTAELDNFFNTTGLPRVVSNYMIFWLTDWVRKFGIDGFRIDTAKHVEMERWARLKQYAISALKDWKAENPEKALDDLEFWMTAEVWGHGKNKSEYHTDGDFNSVINFGLKNDARVSSRQANDLESLFSEYATINDDPTWNSLSYLSSHDVPPLFNRGSLQAAAPGFLLLPGGIQIFYGDESGRPEGNWADEEQNTRSDMNWGAFNQAQHEVWKKLGTFRRDHPAVGAGSHQKISDSPYTFVRDYENQEKGFADRVIVAIGAQGTVSFDVSNYYSEGDTIVDHYTNAEQVVTNGSVSFTADSEGIVLLYNKNYVFVARPVVSISPDTQYDENSITVSISATDKNDPDPAIYYTTDDNLSQADYKNWTVYSSSFELTSSATVRVVAENANGETTYASKKYSVGQIDPMDIYFYKPSDWGSAYIHYFDATPVGVTDDTVWPGVQMTDAGNGWYHASITALSVGIVFNDNGGAQSDDYSRTQSGWFRDGSWTDSCPGDCPGPQVPTVTISPASANYPSGSGNVALSATQSGVIYYTLDGSTPSDQSLPYTGVIPVSGTAGETVTIKAIAYNSEGASEIETGTYTFEALQTFTIYAKGYSHVYYWDVQNENGTITEANPVAWPGVSMVDASEIGTGWMKYEVTGGVCSNVIFTNSGSGQTADLTTCGNEGKGYDNGTWVPLDLGPDITSPSVSISPNGGTFDGEVSVSISSSDDRDTSPTIYYTLDGTDPTTSSTSVQNTTSFTVSTIGVTVVKAYAVDDAGNTSAIVSESFTVNEVTGGFTVYTQGYNNALIHYWNAQPVGSITATSWPGVSMTLEADGWYAFTFPSNVTSTNLLFHDNAGNKSPDLTRDKDGWYRNGQWYDTKPEDPTGLKIHFKSSWGSATRIHYWGTSNGASSNWPGELMTAEGNDWYVYTIEGATSANLLFHNNGGSQTGDLSRSGEGWYKGGQWYSSNPESASRLTSISESNNIISASIYPTQASSNATLKMTLDERSPVNIQVYNMYGQLVKSIKYKPIGLGEQKLNVDVQGLLDGWYFVEVAMGSKREVLRLLKQ
ncbi:chitobiase/beta-hexosaminidase C-terminal domain-containing protein [Sediminitomix flava]|uniref:Putative secreted protein (Por secretion system target) n=1 Tax=Sediminitomix flava TaxID=379075 RepID=A0A315YWG4_SEDFL|nr:chitobiase/beta-hexosaminidase C-terminal domain-containing protein [Sediminitomix flava]PWJ33664.1 putative secreted protein (Por secretion system target) [Sediminitomix flava]